MTDAAGQRGVRTLFFAYFAMIGAYSPYLTLYYAAIGLSIAQIGVLTAVPQLSRIVGPSLWGWLADRLHSRLFLLRLSAVSLLCLTIGLGLVGARYTVLLGVMALLAFVSTAQTPIAESMALAASAGDTGRYGRIRAWGSIGFAGAVMLAGPLLDRIGITNLPWMMAALAATVVLVCWRLPEPPGARSRRSMPVLPRLRDPAIAAFFVSSCLMMFAHAGLYGFYSLYLDGLGWSKSGIGVAWTIGVLAEIAVFRVQRPLFERFGAMRLLSVSLMAAVLRFCLIGWAGGALAGVIVAQLMHALTFGVHHSAAMAVLHRWFDAGQQGRAQALYATIGYGFGGSTGGLVASWVWQHHGPAAVFHLSAVAALAGWFAVLWCARTERLRDGGTARPIESGD